MAYLLDANVFIQAKNLHYGFDFCPAFWDWLEAKNAAGEVFSIEKVGDELEGHSDDLSTWAKGRGAAFFLKPDQALASALGDVSRWATSKDYKPAAVSSFFQVADYFLVAHALAGEHVIVTHEIFKDTRKEIQIPNVCLDLGIKCMTPFEMLRHERARFVLGADG
jgi:hypothetical protein